MIGHELGKMGHEPTPDLPDDFQMTELGPLPKEWRVVRLGEILVPVNREERKIVIEDDREYTLLSVSLYAQGVKVKEAVPGASLKAKIWYRVRKGDFLLLKIWARKGSYGFLQQDFPNAIVSGDYPILELQRHIADEGFVEYFLSLPMNWQRLNAGAKGSTNRQRVHENQFIELISIPLPPLDEQRAIAHVLRTVQRAKEATDGVIVALKELKKSLMQHLFTYGPVPVGAKDFLPQRETEIGPLPAHWRVVRLGEVATLSTKAIDPANAGAKRYIGLEHIEPGNMRIQHFGKANDVRSLKIAFQKGDVLYGKLRPYLDKAVLAEWDGICSTDILVIKVQDGFLPEFLAYLLHTSKFIEYAVSTTTGVNHPRTSWKALQKFPIPLPPLDEQREIARILQAVDAKIAAEGARRAALEELFKTLLHQLMTGKIRVRGVIPTTVDSAESAATED